MKRSVIDREDGHGPVVDSGDVVEVCRRSVVDRGYVSEVCVRPWEGYRGLWEIVMTDRSGGESREKMVEGMVRG